MSKIVVGVFYGIHGKWHDKTCQALNKFYIRGRLQIPADDCKRAHILGDPLPQTLKSIKLVFEDGQTSILDAHEAYDLEVGLLAHQLREVEAAQRLEDMHSQLKLFYGSFVEEYPEQLMAAMFIRPDDIVLEIGANIGRNSCIIAGILGENACNLVAVESDPHSALRLAENRDLNNLKFQIEPSAISNIPLKQNGWVTHKLQPDEILSGSWIKVNTISWPDLKTKYQLEFSCLVLDCEGAFYYILMENMDILDGVRLIIIENDFADSTHQSAVLDIFASRGYKLVYNRGHNVRHDFYQVWSK